MLRVKFLITVNAEDERCWFYGVDRIIVEKSYWVPDEFPFGLSSRPEFMCPNNNEVDWRGEKAINDLKICPCLFCRDLDTDSADETKFAVQLNRQNNTLVKTHIGGSIVVTIEGEDFLTEYSSDNESDSSEELIDTILDKSQRLKRMREMVENCIYSWYGKLTYDTHYDCYCKTQKVCGCGCDPKHDGW